MWLPRKQEEEEYFQGVMLITNTSKVLATVRFWPQTSKKERYKRKREKYISEANTLFQNE